MRTSLATLISSFLLSVNAFTAPLLTKGDLYVGKYINHESEDRDPAHAPSCLIRIQSVNALGSNCFEYKGVIKSQEGGLIDNIDLFSQPVPDADAPTAVGSGVSIEFDPATGVPKALHHPHGFTGFDCEALEKQ